MLRVLSVDSTSECLIDLMDNWPRPFILLMINVLCTFWFLNARSAAVRLVVISEVSSHFILLLIVGTGWY